MSISLQITRGKNIFALFFYLIWTVPDIEAFKSSRPPLLSRLRICALVGRWLRKHVQVRDGLWGVRRVVTRGHRCKVTDILYTRSLPCMSSINFGSRRRVRSLRRTDTSGERTHTHKCCLGRTVRKLSAQRTDAQQDRSRRRGCLGPATRENAHIFRMQSDLKCQRGSSMTHQ